MLFVIIPGVIEEHRRLLRCSSWDALTPLNKDFRVSKQAIGLTQPNYSMLVSELILAAAALIQGARTHLPRARSGQAGTVAGETIRKGPPLFLWKRAVVDWRLGIMYFIYPVCATVCVETALKKSNLPTHFKTIA